MTTRKRSFGEIEFVFATIKVVTLSACFPIDTTEVDELTRCERSVGLIIFGLIADLGGVPPNKDFIGGRYWREEPFNDNFMNLKPVSLSRFLGFWSVLTKGKSAMPLHASCLTVPLSCLLVRGDRRRCRPGGRGIQSEKDDAHGRADW